MSFDRAKSALSGTRFSNLRSVAETGSTNADVKAILSGLECFDRDQRGSEAIVLLADHQTAGRGRLERLWTAPAGSSILMTVGMAIDSIAIERRTLLTMCVSLGVTDAISQLGIDGISIKWPNDIVVDDGGPSSVETSPFGYRKVGGILAEMFETVANGTCVVLGLGLNVNWSEMTDELSATAISLSELTGGVVDRDALVEALLLNLDARLTTLENPARNVGRLVEEYASRCSTIGSPVRVELPNEVLSGVAQGIDSTGALLVAASGAVRAVTVGEVVHLRPQTRP